MSFLSPTLHGALESSSQGHFCALTFELSGAVGVRLNEGLGVARGVPDMFATVRSTVVVFEPRLGVARVWSS